MNENIVRKFYSKEYDYYVLNNHIIHIVIPEYSVSEIPLKILGYTNLKYFIATNNNITIIPSKISNMIYLIYIDICNNLISIIEPGIYKLKNLVKINYNNNLKKVNIFI
jgi:Leucine-rich repeat (LRR) protein